MNCVLKVFKSIIPPLILALWFVPTVEAAPPAQTPTPQNPHLIYTVHSGDTLIGIAFKYNLSQAEILQANHLFNPSLIFPGQKLTLPGIPAPTPTPPPTPTPLLNMPLTDTPHTVQPGETLYSIAETYGVPVGNLVLANSLPHPDVIQVGQTLKIPAGPLPTPGALPPPFESVSLSESTIIQGRTLTVYVSLAEPATVSGSFEGQPLIFNSDGAGGLWAITAIHALLQPNSYPIILTATRPDDSTANYVESVSVIEGPYGFEAIQLDDTRSQLLNPQTLAAERDMLVNLWTQVTPRPRWSGSFWYPIAGNDLRITSYFGTRRTYNNSDELSFHAGADFGGSGIPIYAPAAGRVVLARSLTVRGNAVVIDHGLGLYSNYWHQNQIVVTEGQQVQQGDLIGYVGGTGLVTGPHLHWEVRLNGIAVNPLQWVRESIP